jgi:hypothetical protein
MQKALAFAGLLSAGLLLTSRAEAQIRVGVKGGLNLSNVSGDLANDDLYHVRAGGHIGAIVNVSLIKNFLSLQPEVVFSQKGFTYDNREVTTSGVTTRFEGSRRYQYLDVPVLLKLQAGPLYVEAGPQYARLLNLRDETRVTTNGQQAAQFTTLSVEDVNRNELGYAVGLGLQSKGGLLLGLRYTGAFTDFAKKSFRDRDMVNARNSVFQFSVGFLVPSR